MEIEETVSVYSEEHIQFVIVLVSIDYHCKDDFYESLDRKCPMKTSYVMCKIKVLEFEYVHMTINNYLFVLNIDDLFPVMHR